MVNGADAMYPGLHDELFDEHSQCTIVLPGRVSRTLLYDKVVSCVPFANSDLSLNKSTINNLAFCVHCI